MALNIGDTTGDYQIVGILGAGGMGKVYKVRNVISDRVEAMKVLLPNLAEAPELADRFIREIKTLASLNHPNIAALHTALRQDNQLLMIMEFVEGRTLEDRLREGPVTVWEAVDTISQALSALGYAHERGIVHRDIKPANMMVTASGEVKLMDFGIAKAMADRKLTMTGTTLGSLFYMSPEQVKGSANLDGRSDLYSIGVSLYELLTGIRPFKGDSDYSIMVAHLEQQPVSPLQVDPTLPSDLNEIVMTAIQKDPEQRFQTAQAFRAALESVKQRLIPPPNWKPAAYTAPAAAAPAPTFIPTQAAAPPQVAQAEPAAPQPPAAAKSHRGLWMGLGALVMLAVLAVAAIQVPKWYKTRAGSEQLPVVETQQPPAAQPEASQPAAEVPPQPEAVPPAVETASQPMATPAAAVPSKAAIRMPRGNAASSKMSAAPSKSLTAQPVQMQQQPSAPAAQPPAAQAQIPSHAVTPQVDPEALESARERLGMLGTRANALIAALKNLQQQQQRMGVGMRTDITTSWKRMELLLDESEAALKRQDLAGTKKNLDQAEREADKLDKFLGR